MSVDRVFVEIAGSGPNLVLIHGWGLNRGVWYGIVDELCKSFTLHLVDLPGHGASQASTECCLFEGLVRDLVRRLPAAAAWVGWSLGGTFALRAALDFPDRVDKLILVAAIPRFLQGENWPHAMRPDLLEEFAFELGQDPQATIRRFLALQVRGSVNAQASLRALRTALMECGSASPLGLAMGLRILRDVDMRDEMKRLQVPTKLELGSRDLLVPAAVHSSVRSLLPSVEVEIVEGAGHAPFISHRDRFLALLNDYLG